MTSSDETSSRPGADTVPVDIGHPRGTLAIVLIYGLLFALGWLGLYFFEFASRGTPHP